MKSSKSGCVKCSRKTHILVRCKCTHLFCMSCRYPEVHACGFDYKTDFQKQLTKENPIVTTEKLEKL